MQRDSISFEEAQDRVLEAREEIVKAESWDEAQDIMACDLGIEMDNLEDVIQYAKLDNFEQYMAKHRWSVWSAVKPGGGLLPFLYSQIKSFNPT
jgi:hypothetical protein